jgi:UDP-3-O-[3-hydroxymyristoyl] glucosamine N-acyltransferase
MKEITAEEAIAVLGQNVLAVHGDRSVGFSRPMPVDVAEESAVTFCRKGHARAEAMMRETRASVVVCGPELRELSDPPATGKVVLIVEDPRLEFLRIIQAYFADPRPAGGIHPTAVVHPEAKVDPTAHIGPNCNVGRCEIGANTVLFGNIHLFDRVRIGNNVTIKPGTVIGGAGFGYQLNEKREWEHFPHVGGVVIEDDVSIGANTCIDRGALADTVIKRGAKIDNLVHLAHNVIVGEHVIITGTTQVAGSVVIGDRTWISPSATLLNGIKVGRETMIGIGSVVLQDLPDYARTLPQPAALAPERFWQKPK